METKLEEHDRKEFDELIKKIKNNKGVHFEKSNI